MTLTWETIPDRKNKNTETNIEKLLGVRRQEMDFDDAVKEIQEALKIGYGITHSPHLVYNAAISLWQYKSGILRILVCSGTTEQINALLEDSVIKNSLFHR